MDEAVPSPPRRLSPSILQRDSTDTAIVGDISSGIIQPQCRICFAEADTRPGKLQYYTQPPIFCYFANECSNAT